MTGWAIASIVIGVAFIGLNGRLARWLQPGDDEPISRAYDRWVSRPRLLLLTRVWAVVIGAVFAWLGVSALL